MPIPGIRSHSGVSKKVGSATQAQLSNANTNPRVIWATSSYGMMVDNGGSSTTVQWGASRLKTNLSGGNWAGLASVYLGAMQATKSRIGINNVPKYEIAAYLERSNGTNTPTTYASPNTGGTKVAFTWQGLSSASVIGSQVVVSDIIYPSAFSLGTFSVSDRTLDYWTKTAYAKTAATDNLGGHGRSTYNYPRNEYWGDCNSFAAAKTLIGENGLVSFQAGMNHFGTSAANNSIPGPIGYVGVPSSGQKAILWFGTSIFNGQNVGGFDPGNVNPSPFVPANMDGIDLGSFFADDLSISCPVLSLAAGATSLVDTWGTSPALGDNGSAVNARKIIYELVKYFDYVVMHDVHNDPYDANWQAAYQLCCTTLHLGNPNVKIIAARPPLDVVGITGVTTGAGNANDSKWSYVQGLLNTGISGIDAYFDLRESGNVLWAMLPDRLASGTCTANGSTTTVVDTVNPHLCNTLVYSWIEFTSGPNNGLKRIIGNNDIQGAPGVITLTAALPNATAIGDTYKILGNTSGESDGLNGLHGVYWGYKRLKDNFLAKLQAYDSSFKVFSRSA